MLHLAVDARVVATDARGIGRYERAVLRRLLARTGLEITLLVPGPFAFLQQAALARALDRPRVRVAARIPRSAQVVWHPANGTFFFGNAPSVATIHDAVPFRYPASDPKRRAHDQEPFRRSAASARRIITVSHFAARELEEVLEIDPARIDVIYHGVDPSFRPGDPGEPPPRARERGYLLFVGNAQAEARKNFGMLYDAYRGAWPNGDGPALVVAGAQAPELPGVVAAGELGDDLRGSGDTRLRNLYRGALAVTVPSYHETFGMPLAEAMACGAPVLAANASCLPEIGGDAALYADPHDARAWSASLVRIANDRELRVQLRERGLKRAAQFDWEHSAQAHVEVLARVAEGSAR